MSVEDVPRRLASACSVFNMYAGDRAVKTAIFLRFTSYHNVIYILTVVYLWSRKSHWNNIGKLEISFRGHG